MLRPGILYMRSCLHRSPYLLIEHQDNQHGSPICVQNHTLREHAVKAEELIHRALALHPVHPLATHLLIHVAEASSPLRCDDAAPASSVLLHEGMSALDSWKPERRLMRRGGLFRAVSSGDILDRKHARHNAAKNAAVL